VHASSSKKEKARIVVFMFIWILYNKEACVASNQGNAEKTKKNGFPGN
jgi:hypothetical protein